MSTKVGGIEFTDSAIGAMKAGEQVNGVVGSDGQFHSSASHFTPRASLPIQGHGKELKPQVRDKHGELVNPTGERVTAPAMSKNNSKHEAEKARIAAELQVEREALAEQRRRLAPAALVAELDDAKKRIAFLERAIKRLTKTVKEVQER